MLISNTFVSNTAQICRAFVVTSGQTKSFGQFFNFSSTNISFPRSVPYVIIFLSGYTNRSKKIKTVGAIFDIISGFIYTLIACIYILNLLRYATIFEVSSSRTPKRIGTR